MAGKERLADQHPIVGSSSSKSGSCLCWMLMLDEQGTLVVDSCRKAQHVDGS